MTIGAELQRVEAERYALLETPCADCGHSYRDHNMSLISRCFNPRVVKAGDEKCRCRRFTESSAPSLFDEEIAEEEGVVRLPDISTWDGTS